MQYLNILSPPHISRQKYDYSRIVLAIGDFAIGVELPKAYIGRVLFLLLRLVVMKLVVELIERHPSTNEDKGDTVE